MLTSYTNNQNSLLNYILFHYTLKEINKDNFYLYFKLYFPLRAINPIPQHEPKKKSPKST